MSRAAFKPTKAKRDRVSMLAAARMSQPDIGRVVGCDEKTLRKYFAEELTLGAAKKNAEIVTAMFKAAKGGNVSAQKYLLARHDAMALTPAAESKPRKPAKLGKKELLDADSQRPPSGEWGELVKH